jgi:N-acetylmuramic acid 6-phosphate etherase
MSEIELELDGLTTEAADDRFADIDRLPTLDVATLMNEADRAVPVAVQAALPAIAAAVDAIARRMADGGRLIYLGAGTSGRLGVLDASECGPTFGTRPDEVLAVMAGGIEAFVTPVEGAEDDTAAGAAAVDDLGVSTDDVVVGIASSGRTPYVLAAVERARAAGALTVGLSCNSATALSAAVDHAIEVPVGPELIAGSTRLKAGTAQKLVLNMLSTLTMVRLGKTFGNLMVDLRPTNGKLRVRAAGIVAGIAGVPTDAANEALESTGYDVKVAVLVARLGVTPHEAVRRLAAHHGRLRDALEDPGADT